MSAEDNREAIASAAAATAVQPDAQAEAHRAALEEQKRGYEARLKVLASGRFDWAGEERLRQLVAGVEVELAKLGVAARVKRASKPAKAKRQPAKSKG